VIFDFLLNR